jgi:hypothetical protein
MACEDQLEGELDDKLEVEFYVRIEACPKSTLQEAVDEVASDNPKPASDVSLAGRRHSACTLTRHFVSGATVGMRAPP